MYILYNVREKRYTRWCGYFQAVTHDENMVRLRAPMGLGVTYIKNVGVGMGRLAKPRVAHSVYCHFTLYIPVSLL